MAGPASRDPTATNDSSDDRGGSAGACRVVLATYRDRVGLVAVDRSKRGSCGQLTGVATSGRPMPPGWASATMVVVAPATVADRRSGAAASRQGAAVAARRRAGGGGSRTPGEGGAGTRRPRGRRTARRKRTRITWRRASRARSRTGPTATSRRGSGSPAGGCSGPRHGAVHSVNPSALDWLLGTPVGVMARPSHGQRGRRSRGQVPRGGRAAA
jgi:hypothetical protein